LVFVRFPAKIQTEPKNFARLLADFSLPAADYDRAKPGSELLSFAASRGIPVLDLLHVLESPGARSNPKYFEEGHPNRAGNQSIGAAIAERILRIEGASPPRDGSADISKPR
jgi:lysophospholipase L1-like esterase